MIFGVRPETVHLGMTNIEETILGPRKSQPCSLYRTAGLSHLYTFRMCTECIPCRCPHDIVHVDSEYIWIENVRPSTCRECTPNNGLAPDRSGKTLGGIRCSDQEEQCCCVRILQGKLDIALCCHVFQPCTGHRTGWLNPSRRRSPADNVRTLWQRCSRRMNWSNNPCTCHLGVGIDQECTRCRT